MLLLSTTSESAFQHVQGDTSRELWTALERAFAPHTISREYTLKSQLLRLKMEPDETSSAYLLRARQYADALANIGEPFKEKDLVMLVVTGLREEYDGFKSQIVGRQFPAAFSDLHALLSDHDYMLRKPPSASVQAFAAAAPSAPTASAAISSLPPDTVHALQQVLSQLGLQVQPQSSLSQPTSQQPQAHYASRGRGCGSHNRGRGARNNSRNYNNNHSFNNSNGGNRSQFSWASNQNTVFGTCNRCGIGHIPSQCPNRDPNTMRSPPPSANFADHRSQTFTNWLPDTCCNGHSAMDQHNLDHSEPYYGTDAVHPARKYSKLLREATPGSFPGSAKYVQTMPLPEDTVVSKDLVPDSDPLRDEDVNALCDFFNKSKKLVVLTGAGISTECGIPDYRSPKGAYSTGFEPMTHQKFMSSIRARKKYWAYSYPMWRNFKEAKPGPAHTALASLEKANRISLIITQNIDGAAKEADATIAIVNIGKTECDDIAHLKIDAQVGEILPRVLEKLGIPDIADFEQDKC
ncbi:hypothetical protein CTI12_AA094000 [Artemisia annua]|uniref:Deacetylase sirtuin-type domain-containing protein n=1 Tax=Artemisia annua TaxID=35608 RepID=A0A2U1PZJ6_ARTAN|nr:hypothetical protein CTI12_AA094000 [Artemisia annua]